MQMKNSKYSCYTKEEMKEIIGGATWVVISREYAKSVNVDSDGAVHWYVRTQEQKYHNDGTPYAPPIIRSDK